MRTRIALVAAAALATVTVPAGAASAAGKDPSCADAASGWTAYTLYTGWKAGDPVPAPGTDLLWDSRVAGVYSAGFTLEEFAAHYGFASVEQLYAVKSVQFASSDTNGNGVVCVKDGPTGTQKGFPDYAAIFSDDKTASKG